MFEFDIRAHVGADNECMTNGDHKFHKLSEVYFVATLFGEDVFYWIERAVGREIPSCTEISVYDDTLVELKDLCETLLKTRDFRKALKEFPEAKNDEDFWNSIEYTVNSVNLYLEFCNMNSDTYVDPFVYTSY